MTLLLLYNLERTDKRIHLDAKGKERNDLHSMYISNTNSVNFI